MIEGRLLLGGLRQLLTPLRDDLRDRIGEDAALEAGLRADWTQARDRGRTGAAYADWLDEEITQAAVHWILGCVFLRFIEDNVLVERPWLAGPRARGTWPATATRPTSGPTPHSDRDYLTAFREAETLPALGALFDEAHNPLWRSPPAATGPWPSWLLAGGRPGHRRAGPRLHRPGPDTRFLGDLYQDLSEPARKHYALLQTPDFVEEFILDRTLDPAIESSATRRCG